MRENLLKNIHRIFLFGFFVMTQWRCTNAPNGAFNHIPIVKVPTKITSYPLEDYEGELHKYRDDFDSFKSLKIPFVSLIIFLFNSSLLIPTDAIRSYEPDLMFFNKIIAFEAFKVDII